MTSTSLYAALNTALTGLSVNQQALATLSQNIANANTPGYSRQVVNLADNVVNGAGYGVKVEDVTRQINQFLERSAQQQNAVYSNANTLNNYAQQIQSLLGQPSGSDSTTTDSSIASAVTSFFSSLQQLSQSPSSGSLQLTAVQSGQSLATQVSGLASGLENLRYQADQQIGQDVTTVNSTLQSLYSLNSAIGLSSNSGSGTVSPDLLDQRDTLLSTLSQYMDINYYYDSNQEVHISTSGGQTLLDGGVSQLSYTPQSSVSSFSSGSPMSPITLQTLDANGNPVGNPQTLVSGGASSSVTTSMTTGEIRGLLDVRDTEVPQLMDQLDTLASTVRDQMNTIQNSGSPYPGAASYTGQRAVGAADDSAWTGNVQIALLGQNGQPVASPYAGNASGLPPLNLDLGGMDTGAGTGNPSVQGIINAINSYYTPQNQVSLGDITNIQMASDTPSLPTSPAQFNFDFNLQNLSAKPANLFVTGVTVTDDTGATVTSSATTTAPVINLASANTYTTTADSNTVTIATSAPPGVANGDYVYLSAPPSSVNGLSTGDLSGFFQVSNVTATGFDITAADKATSSGSVSDAGMTATPKYATIGAGDSSRTNGNGTFTVDLTGNPTSAFYTVSADVTTQNADGTLSTGTIQYRVQNPETNMLNNLYGGIAAGGSAVLTTPSSTAPLLTATLVDANGNELPKVNGQYVTSQTGYLKITAAGSSNVVAINSEDSQQLGFPKNIPAQAGTNQGFSSYFGLNNFFNANNLTSTGDSVANSALNLSVNSTLLNNPSMISTGQLTQSPPNADGTPVYTYERDAGDNSVLQQMANLGNNNLSFSASGGLGDASTTLNGYAGEILGFASSSAASTQSTYSNAQLVMNSLNSQNSSASGVNLDQELANTVIYQNAYTASARILTVVDSLFQTLLQSFTS